MAVPAALLRLLRLLLLVWCCCCCCLCLVSGQATVQFSFCLLTSLNPTPSLALEQWSSLTSGILDTATPAADWSASGSYVVTALLNASFYSTGARLPMRASLLPLEAYAGNDNVITVSAHSSAASTDHDGLSWSAGDYTLNVWNDASVECFPDGVLLCGSVASFTVQRYTTGGAVLPCSRPLPQFSFCLITGEQSAPTLLLGGWSSYMSGILTASDAAFPYISVPGDNYYPSHAFTIANISHGFYATVPPSAQQTQVKPNTSLSLLPVNAWGSNDNRISFTSVQDGGLSYPTGVTFDSHGMTMAVGNGGRLRAYSKGQAACEAPAVCGPYHSFTAALYNSQNPAVSCGPLAQFSFCFITGSASPPSLQRGHYSTIVSGLLNSNVSGYSGSHFPILSMINGRFWNSSSDVPETATLLSRNAFADNDNVLIVSGGSGQASTDSGGLSFGAFSIDAINIFSSTSVECTYPSKCGKHGLLLVRQYNATSGVLPCEPPSSSSSSSAETETAVVSRSSSSSPRLSSSSSSSASARHSSSSSARPGVTSSSGLRT